MQTIKSDRHIETIIEAGDNGQQLCIRTTHDKSRKQYYSYVARNVLKGAFVTEKISFREEERPMVAPSVQSAPRYSAKTLENIHGKFLSDVPPSLAHLTEWAADQTTD